MGNKRRRVPQLPLTRAGQREKNKDVFSGGASSAFEYRRLTKGHQLAVFSEPKADHGECRTLTKSEIKGLGYTTCE